MTALSFRVLNISDCLSLLPQVVALGDSQKKTLGFLAEGAFNDYARKNWIYVAVADDMVLGYAAFRLKKGLVCSLTHLCVDPEYRKKGIAGVLLKKLKERTKNFYKITLRCRRDYGLDSFWSKHGFVPRTEVVGRASLFRSILTVWDFKQQNTLFDLPPIAAMPVAVMDLNVLIGATSDDDIECTTLLLHHADDIDFRISEHSFNEANRNEDVVGRQKTISDLKSFKSIPCSSDKQLLNELNSFFSKTQRDDVRQLASALSFGAEYFITKDKGILSKANVIEKNYSLTICSPIEFLHNFSIDGTDKLYAPKFAQYSDVTLEPLLEFAEDELFQQYRVENEKKSTFRKKLVDSFVGNKPHLFNICALGNDLGVCALTVSNDEVHIHLLRMKKILQHKRTICIHLIENLIQYCLNRKVKRIYSHDLKCGKLVQEALLSAGFVEREDYYLRILLKGVFALNEVLGELGLRRLTEDRELPNEILVELENTVWPGKIQQLEIPTYIIPIQPQWAQKLISPIGFQEDLFPRSDIMVQTQRVYYRSSNGGVPQNPARILWYVSGDRKEPGKFIFAVSQIDQVDVDSVKSLFTRYERLGVFSWNDIFPRAGKNIENEMMAILFSKTELLKHRVSYQDVEEIVLENEDRRLNLVSVYEIKPSTFERIYRLGGK